MENLGTKITFKLLGFWRKKKKKKYKHYETLLLKEIFQIVHYI